MQLQHRQVVLLQSLPAFQFAACVIKGDGLAGGKVTAQHPVRALVAGTGSGGKGIHKIGVAGPAVFAAAGFVGNALVQGTAGQQTGRVAAVIRRRGEGSRTRGAGMAVPDPAVFPGEQVAVQVGKGVHQGVPVVGDIRGQGGHADIECLERSQRQGRVEKCAAEILLLGGTSAPLPGIRVAVVAEGLAQLKAQKHRVVVCRTGADSTG